MVIVEEELVPVDGVVLHVVLVVVTFRLLAIEFYLVDGSSLFVELEKPVAELCQDLPPVQECRKLTRVIEIVYQVQLVARRKVEYFLPILIVVNILGVIVDKYLNELLLPVVH